ncbi:MAG: hypothetical protein ACYDCQ_11320, partial [Dehalococcoidia bacterium]
YGRHRQQTLEYALKNCLPCRKLKTCVRKSWGVDRQRPWRREDWWEVTPQAQRPGRRPPWPSSPPAAG